MAKTTKKAPKEKTQKSKEADPTAPEQPVAITTGPEVIETPVVAVEETLEPIAEPVSVPVEVVVDDVPDERVSRATADRNKYGRAH